MNSAATTAAATPKQQPPEKSVDADLKEALTAPLSQQHIPLTVSATFVDTPDNGPIVNAGVLASTTQLDYGTDGKQAAIDVAGVILNDQGKTAGSLEPG